MVAALPQRQLRAGDGEPGRRTARRTGHGWPLRPGLPPGASGAQRKSPRAMSSLARFPRVWTALGAGGPVPLQDSAQVPVGRLPATERELEQGGQLPRSRAMLGDRGGRWPRRHQEQPPGPPRAGRHQGAPGHHDAGRRGPPRRPAPRRCAGPRAGGRAHRQDHPGRRASPRPSRAPGLPPTPGADRRAATSASSATGRPSSSPDCRYKTWAYPASTLARSADGGSAGTSRTSSSVRGQGGLIEAHPQVATEPLMQQAGPDRIRQVHVGQRLPDQLDRPRVLVKPVGRLGRPLQQRDPVERADFGRLRHPPHSSRAARSAAGPRGRRGRARRPGRPRPRPAGPAPDRRLRPSGRPTRRRPPPADHRPAQAAR